VKIHVREDFFCIRALTVAESSAREAATSPAAISPAAPVAASAESAATASRHAAFDLEMTNLAAHVARFVCVGAVTLGVFT
jgi:hypothetical protein